MFQSILNTSFKQIKPCANFFRETADGILLHHYCNITLSVVWSRAYHLDNQSSSNNNNNNDDNNTKWNDVSSIVKCEA